MNIAQPVEQGAMLYPDKLALIFEHDVYTYKQLNQLSNRIADGLTALNIISGDRVGLILPNTPAFVFCYLGILKLGAVAVSLNTSLKSREMQFILNDSGAKVLITTTALYTALSNVELPYITHMIQIESEAKPEETLATLMSASAETQAMEMKADDLALLLYTSGTTDFPKGAMLSHGNVITNGEDCIQAFDLTADDYVLLCLPMFHCFGQNAALNPCLAAGATLILHQQFEPEPVLRSIEEQGATTFFGVPTIYRILYEHTTPTQLRTVKRFISAAATLPSELAHKWQKKFGVGINEGYGLTETCLNTLNLDIQTKLGSVGRSLAKVDLCVVDEQGMQVAPDELGEVLVRGSNVMLGYWKHINEIDGGSHDGWFRTGDIGRIDQDGYVYIIDRLKDMINVGGNKVYASEVENILYQHPAVQEAAVYNIPDATLGELVTASIVVRPSHQITAAELITFCHQHLAYYKVPSIVQFAEILPKGRTGKILKRELREKMQRQALSEILIDNTPNTRPQFIERRTIYFSPRTPEELEMTYLWEETFDIAPISINDNFFELGGNSLMALQLLTKVREKYGEQLPLSILFQYPTIVKLAALLKSGSDATHWSPLVPIRTQGNKTPFFCVSGAGSNGLYLYPLAQALGNDQPFYTLQAVGLDGFTKPHETVEEAAAYYIQAIKQIQPQGPYDLGGHSFGGWVAFEMAQQLQKAGEKVRCLILLDSISLRDRPQSSQEVRAVLDKSKKDQHLSQVESQPIDEIEVILLWEDYYVSEFGSDNMERKLTREMLEPLSTDERMARLLTIMEQVYAPQGSSIAEVRGMLEVTRMNMQTTYHPVDLVPVPFHFFAAKGLGEEVNESLRQSWGQLIPMTFHVIPGGHTTMITNPQHVQVLAQEVASCLESARIETTWLSAQTA